MIELVSMMYAHLAALAPKHSASIALPTGFRSIVRMQGDQGEGV